jgi:hypothetical protein
VHSQLFSNSWLSWWQRFYRKPQTDWLCPNRKWWIHFWSGISSLWGVGDCAFKKTHFNHSSIGFYFDVSANSLSLVVKSDPSVCGRPWKSNEARRPLPPPRIFPHVKRQSIHTPHKIGLRSIFSVCFEKLIQIHGEGCTGLSDFSQKVNINHRKSYIHHRKKSGSSSRITKIPRIRRNLDRMINRCLKAFADSSAELNNYVVTTRGACWTIWWTHPWWPCASGCVDSNA